MPSGLIAFVGAEDSATGKLTLHVVNADGSELRELTEVGPLGEPHGNPSFSFDGQWIAFQVSTSGFGNDIYKIRVDGSGLTNLTEGKESGWGPPTWSPDGRVLAVSRDLGGFDIVLLDAVTGDVGNRLTNFQAPVAQTSAFTPDGQFLIVSSTPPPGVEPVGQEDLWEIRLADGSVRRITETVQDESFLDVSPDGSLIAVHAEILEEGDRVQNGPVEVVVIERSTGNRTRVTHSRFVNGNPRRQDQASFPAWSPRGCFIVYQSSPSGQVVEVKLFTQPIDRFRPKQLTTIPAAVQADWSPN